MNIEKHPKGLGDTIEAITKATGIKKLVKWVFGKDCGCSERKTKLRTILNLIHDIFIYLNVNC